jgi:ring-1,2-phenylacetyl-CoA epoxidase subunit PaaB
MEKSLDPRIARLDIQRSDEHSTPIGKHEYWETYEVFVQSRRGKQHIHAGTVHAPDAEMALVFAKEQFGRRQHCVNMWVVATTDIFAFQYADSDMFDTVPEKLHREPGGYKVRDKIEAYRKKISQEKADKS